MPKKFPKSIRKFLRQEKAKVRRRFLDSDKQKEEIDRLYERVNLTKKKFSKNRP